MLLLWCGGAFFLGAWPWAVWIGRIFLQTEITQYGDGNPGATNLWRAGGRLTFFLAIILEISKAAIPTGLAQHIAHLPAWQVALIAIMPPLGHTFSPFLRFQGGKAVAACFGAWIGVALWGAWPPLLLLIIWARLITPSGWVVLLTMLSWGGLLWWQSAEPLNALIWLPQTLLLIWTHRQELAQLPQMKVMG